MCGVVSHIKVDVPGLKRQVITFSGTTESVYSINRDPNNFEAPELEEGAVEVKRIMMGDTYLYDYDRDDHVMFGDVKGMFGNWIAALTAKIAETFDPKDVDPDTWGDNGGMSGILMFVTELYWYVPENSFADVLDRLRAHPPTEEVT